MAFLKKFSKALIDVGKTVEFLLTDNSIPLADKESKTAELFERKVQDLIVREYLDTDEIKGKDIMEQYISQSLNELGIDVIDPETNETKFHIDGDENDNDEQNNPAWNN